MLRVPVCLSSTQVRMKFQQIGALLKRGEFVNAYLFSSLKQTEHNNPVHKRSDRNSTDITSQIMRTLEDDSGNIVVISNLFSVV